MDGRTRKLKHQYGQLLEIMNEFRELSGKEMLEESQDSMRYTQALPSTAEGRTRSDLMS